MGHMSDDGIFSTPLQSGCRARLNSDQTGISSGWTPLDIVDTSDYDVQGEFGNLTHRFTVTEDGNYVVAVEIYLETIPNAIIYGVCVFKNGVATGALALASAGVLTSHGIAASDIMDLDATDYLDLRVYHSNSSALVAPAAVNKNYMAVHKIA